MTRLPRPYKQKTDTRIRLLFYVLATVLYCKRDTYECYDSNITVDVDCEEDDGERIPFLYLTNG